MSNKAKGRKAEKMKARRAKAEERNAKWAALTPEKQLEVLDVRLGKGVGAAKQRARLAKAIHGSKTTPRGKK